MTIVDTGSWPARRKLTATQKLMLRGAAVVAGVAVLSLTLGAGSSPVNAGDEAPTPYTGTAMMSELSYLRRSLDATRGELELTRLERDRANAILEHSARYAVPADVAGLVYDVALSEGMDPELAFRLVKIESGFKPRAKSRAGAFGLAQVQLATARHYEPEITQDQLYEPERNLRIGFRYLRDLMRKYEGNTTLALLAYNRGPARVQSLIQGGRDPRNGYASSVMQGYERGSGAAGAAAPVSGR